MRDLSHLWFFGILFVDKRKLKLKILKFNNFVYVDEGCYMANMNLLIILLFKSKKLIINIKYIISLQIGILDAGGELAALSCQTG